MLPRQPTKYMVIHQLRCPLLELEVMLLDVVFEVYDRVRALIQHLTSGI
jgi:hypothetical protein